MNGCAVCHLSIAFSLLGLTTLPCSSSAQNSIQGEHNRTTEDPCFPFRSYDGSYNEWCVIFSKVRYSFSIFVFYKQVDY